MGMGKGGAGVFGDHARADASEGLEGKESPTELLSPRANRGVSSRKGSPCSRGYTHAVSTRLFIVDVARVIASVVKGFEAITIPRACFLSPPRSFPLLTPTGGVN